jgi:hypothetical protein
MTNPTRPTFEGAFPNITIWVQDCGTVEIGNDPNTSSFVRAIDEGGTVWSGANHYENLDDALQDLEAGLGQILVGKALGAESSAKRRTTRKPPSPKHTPVSRRKGSPEAPTTKQVRKIDAIVEAIRGKENVLITRLTVVKKLCENPDAASAFALFLARRAQERLREKKAKERYRQLANSAVKEMKHYLDKPTEDGKWRLLDLLHEIKEEQNEHTPIKWGLVRNIKCWDLLVVEKALQGFMRPEEAKFWLYQAAADHVGSSEYLTAKSIPRIEEIARFWRRHFKIKG